MAVFSMVLIFLALHAQNRPSQAVKSPGALPATSPTEWSYEGPDGPEHWAELGSANALCRTGREQSPVDIRIAKKAQLPSLRFEYKSGPLKIIDNGHTAIRVNYDPGNGNFLIVGEKRYELRQFHFHRPSEEYVDGKRYDMSIHFMHEAEDGTVAAVAVLVKAGRANLTSDQLWRYIPQSPGKVHEISGVKLNPLGLLPQHTGYYTYRGSLTAPPCTEGVVWFVLKTPVNISPDKIKVFADLYSHNVRPLQPLNRRVVFESR